MTKLKLVYKYLTLCLLMALISSCKVSKSNISNGPTNAQQEQHAQQTNQNIFHYEPWRWSLEIPEFWIDMTDSTSSSMAATGKERIEEKGVAMVDSTNHVLMLQSNEPKGTLVVTEWKYDSTKMLPYYEGRIKRFQFFEEVYSRVPTLKVSSKSRGFYLGNLYFEAIMVEAESSFSGRKYFHADFETLHKGNVILMQIDINSQTEYQQTLDKIIESKFMLPETNTLNQWQDINLTTASIRFPQGFIKSRRSSDSLRIYGDKEKRELIYIEETLKTSKTLIEMRDKADISKVLADISFGTRQLADDVRVTSGATEEKFLAGKRFFIGEYDFLSGDNLYTNRSAYLTGKNATYKIRHIHPVDQEEGQNRFELILRSLKEEISEN